MVKKKTSTKNKEDFLFEIGVEELPASFISIVKDEEGEHIPPFYSAFKAVLQSKRIESEELKLFVTPRRITFSAILQTCQARRTLDPIEEKGPPTDIAEKDGKKTKAYFGYIKKVAAKYGITEAMVEKNIDFVNIGGRKYVTVYGLELPGKKVISILPELIKKYITDVHFPKNMRWEESGIRFPRPIRWIVALYGDKIIPVRIASVKSSNISRGHRFLGKSKVPIKTAELNAYIKTLKKEAVIVDHIYPFQETTTREEMIIKQIKAKCASLDVDLNKLDKDLIKTIANLVESPAVFVGNFKKEYLRLPKEVLASSMKKHQKVLACYTKRGAILNKFIGVSNGKRSASAMKTIIKNVENVLEARLCDAQFFYDEDTKTPLEEKVQKLKGIIFLGKLGTVYDKITRFERYVDHIVTHDNVELSKEEIDALRVAARLSKADLVTNMVYEFPELQGLVGQHYAAHDGLGKAVAQGVFEHYLPRFKGDAIPHTKVGEFLAVFDKIDTLCGAFSIGLEPTGSQDPYALRRAAIGVVRILKERKIPLSLTKLLTFGCSLFTSQSTFSENEVCGTLREFIRDKVQLVFEESLTKESDKELLRAAMNTSFDNIAHLETRFSCIKKQFKKDPERFAHIAKVCERTHNITKGEEGLTETVDPAFFQDDLERKLYDTYLDVKDSFVDAFENNDLDRCLIIYFDAFHTLVHEFFDKVLVNVEDAAVRKNRKSVMKLINDLFTTRIADLSFIRV